MCSLGGKQLYSRAAAIHEPGSTVVHVYAGFVYYCCYHCYYYCYCDEELCKNTTGFTT